MKKGRYKPSATQEFIVPVVDVDLYQDGRLWTLYFVEEHIGIGADGIMRPKPDAPVINAVLQEPDPPSVYITVELEEALLKKARARFNWRRGGGD